MILFVWMGSPSLLVCAKLDTMEPIASRTLMNAAAVPVPMEERATIFQGCLTVLVPSDFQEAAVTLTLKNVLAIRVSITQTVWML
jgi:hypothetical protein